MNEEELKLLDKIEELPKELNIEIRGLILSEVCLRKENQQLKKQYCERTDCSGRIGNSKKVEELEKQLEASEKARKEALSVINSKEYVIDFSTFGYELNNYEIFKLKNILDIDKGE